MLHSVKQELQSGPRDQSLRRAFNTVLRGGQTLDATINAISTLKPSLKSRYAIRMSEFDIYYPTEPRMVYTLGIIYYIIMLPNDKLPKHDLDWITSVLLKLADATDDKKENLAPYKYFDDLESKLKRGKGQTKFYRKLFDGSMRTMRELMKFLGGSKFDTMPLKKSDFVGRWNCKYTTYASMDLDKVEVELENEDPIVYYNGEKCEEVESLGKGKFGKVVLYKAGSVHVALKIYKYKNDPEIQILQNLDGFETCNVIGIRLIKTKGYYFGAMAPANGNLQNLLPVKSEKVAKKVIYEMAKMYGCMIRQRGLFYNDIKPHNVLFSCDSSESIRLFAGDIGGFCDPGKPCPSTYRAPLPFDNILVYDMEEQTVTAYPKKAYEKQQSLMNYFVPIYTTLAPSFLASLDIAKFDMQDMADNVAENDMFLKIENVYKSGEYVLLRFQDGPNMMEKYLNLVDADKTTKTKYLELKLAKKPAKQCAANGKKGRCVLSKKGDEKCHYSAKTKRCRKKRIK